jgi:hypothetical protein
MTVENFALACVDLVKIDDEDFAASLLDQAEKYAVVADSHRQAFMQAASLKSKRSILEGKLDEKIRSFFNAGLVESAPDAKNKTKLTEAQIQAKIQADPEFIAAVDSCNEADSYLKFAENILEGMKQRKDMLSTLVAFVK